MRLLPEPDRFREIEGMRELPSDDVDIFHESGVFYQAAGTRWKPGQPLLSWNRLKAEGVVTDEDWQHRTPVAQDGDVIPLHADLAEARRWARTGETIVRIRIPGDHQDKIRLDSEQFYAFPESIPWGWCEVVEVKV